MPALNEMTGRVRLRQHRTSHQLRTPADIVLANLTGGLILRTARQLGELVAPGGLLIVSGFMDSERRRPDGARRLVELAALVRRMSGDARRSAANHRSLQM